MDVVVLGGHGQIARQLLARLAARGDVARGIVRNPDHADDLRAIGAEPVVGDVEHESITPLVAGADAVVMAAGAGPGSGPDRKRTVDLGGALKLIEAAKANHVPRYVMVSAMGAGDPESAAGPMRVYQQAKAEADAALMASGLEFTIVRPGGLTDDPGTGRVEAAESLGRSGARGRSITRADTAAVLLAVLDPPSTIGRTFEVLEGRTPIAEAIAAL
ncbi:MAG: hypothetical protein QOH11_3209 [Solirubrobacteraceae bacterium]|jgi:uncharacterized protein YbjT (DUF2867 family)|nr:hypothetical protein [Solirubrobacteraceae bacterium]